MPHDPPFAGKTVQADWAYYLDTAAAYTPQLTATTTNPNLGDDGEAVGMWQRNGHFISGWARFLFAGAGIDPGDGNYEITLPFEADTSAMSASALGGAASIVGNGFIRDNDTVTNSDTVMATLRTLSAVGMLRPGTTTPVDHDTPFVWAANDRISIFFAYLADPAGLPT